MADGPLLRVTLSDTNLPVLACISHPDNKLPVTKSALKSCGCDAQAQFFGKGLGLPAMFPYPNVLDPTNPNLTGTQKELLLWHQRLAHLSFEHLQALMRCKRPNLDGGKDDPDGCTPCIKPKLPNTHSCKAPMCKACQIACAKQQNAGVVTQQPDPNARNVTFDAKIPGDTCSLDQYVCHVRRRLPNT